MKGQISINTIIALIIALSVLVGIMLFFSGRFADISEDVSEIQDSTNTNYASCVLSCNSAKSVGDISIFDSESCPTFECSVDS
jgi:hypothetical protein